MINLAQLVTTVDVTTPGVRAGRGPDRGQRLAETVARRLSQRWTDPGAAPTMDPLRAADRLADNQACRMAVRIYESVLPERRPTTVVDMASYQATQERYDRCREEVRLADLLAEDARATFSLEIDAESMAPRIAKAMQDALPESGLTEALPRWTNKPASVHAEPGFLSLDFRYDPAPYRAATARRPQYESRGQPILYLDPFLALIDGLVALREAAIARLPPYDRLNLRELQTQIRFHRLPDDRITLVFSDLDGRLLIADSLLVKVGYRPEVKVDSVRSGVSRSLRFWLGPPEDEAGDITDYGLVFRFFGLE